MSNPLSRVLLAAASALLLAPAAVAQTGEPAGSAAPDEGAATAESAAGTTGTGTEPSTQEPLPTAPATPPPSLTPPTESYYGAPAAGTEGTSEGAAGGTTGTPPDEGAAGPAEGGSTEPNPAEALLAASHEAHEDQAAEHEAEQVSWQEEASRYIELKGYFRTRPQLFYQLNLGRRGTGVNPRDSSPFPQPYDNGITSDGSYCTGTAGESCFNNDTIAGANMRLRLEPVIHLSSYVQVYATIDLLDNLVLGSTPEGYANQPSASGFQLATARDPWVPLSAFAATQVPPVSGINSFKDSATVKRAWAEVTTPIGRLMFGRMQSQWGLGLLANGGNDIDSDYGDVADRIMWAARYEGLIGALGFDFAGEGPTSQAIFQMQGQPWDLGQLDDVNQYVAVLGYRPTEEEQLARLRSGLPAIAGGVYYVFRNQVLSSENYDSLGNTTPTLVQRDAWAHIFDAWFQFRMERFRAETEWVVIYGGIKNIEIGSYVDAPYDILQYGGVLQLEYTLLGQPTVRSNRLRLGLEGGIASGDPNQEGLSPNDGLLYQHAGAGDHSLSTFSFDPGYNIDLILFRQIIGEVTGAYYLRPWVDYTLGLGAGRSKKFLTFRLDMIWSRASEFMSTLSNKADLGLELDAAVTFETADNFIATLKYGVFFPFGGFEDLANVDGSQMAGGQYGLSNAQTVQALLGVTF